MTNFYVKMSSDNCSNLYPPLTQELRRLQSSPMKYYVLDGKLKCRNSIHACNIAKGNRPMMIIFETIEIICEAYLKLMTP